MLAKKPEARPQTAHEVIERLTIAPIPLAKTLSSVMAAQAATGPARTGSKSMSQAQKAGLLTLAIIFAVGAISAGLAWNQPERHARRLMPTDVELEPEAVEAAADDFGRNELKEPRPRKLLEKWPKAQVLPLMQRLAQGGASWHQWGALRFVDVQFAGQGLPLVPLYIEALASKDCSIRSVAAKRLSELRSAAAAAPLEALKAQAKKPECGQDAAAAALLKLERDLRP